MPAGVPQGGRCQEDIQAMKREKLYYNTINNEKKTCRQVCLKVGDAKLLVRGTLLCPEQALFLYLFVYNVSFILVQILDVLVRNQVMSLNSNSFNYK